MRRFRRDLSIQNQQLRVRHPKVRQRKQRDQLCPALLQPAVAHLHVTEVALDHPKRMLDLGAHAGLQALDLVEQAVDRP